MTLSTIALVLNLIFVCKATDENPTVLAYKELSDKLITSYDKSLSPKLGENSSVEVGITLYGMDIGFCSKEKELSIDMYFRQIWTDQRLQFSDYGINVTGGQSLVDKIWTPDTFFSSVSTIRPVKYPAPNVFVKISPTGDILFTQRFQVQIRCSKAQPNSPHTSKINCTLDIESYGHQSSEIKYYWAKGQQSIAITQFRDKDEFKLSGFKGTEKTVTLSTGNYSILEAVFNLLTPTSSWDLIKQF